jgi:hypothetical protein
MIEIPDKWKALKCTEAWLQLRELMDTAVNTLLREVRDELEVMDAYRVVLRALSVATEVVLDPNPAVPVFVRMDTPARNISGDNPDAEYDISVIDGRQAYRITGSRGTVNYLGFQVLGGRGMTPRHHVTYIKDQDLSVDDKGKFELILSVEKPKVPGQWIRISEDSSAIVVRQYIGDRGRAQLATYAIETLDPPGDIPIPDDAETAERLISTAWTMVKLSLLYRDIPVLHERPNQLTEMTSQQAGAADSTPDNTYMLGVYDLQPDEALVIEVKPPETRYWNVTVENIWHECIDYMRRPVSITGDHVKLREDGKAVFVISHRRPEALPDNMNWLDTAGRRRGFVLLRWIDCPKVEAPEVRVLTGMGGLSG